MSNNKREDITENLKDIFQKVIGTIDYTDNYKELDRTENRTMAMLSYLIPPIPFIVERNSAYVRFHSNQGMNALVWYILISLFIWVVSTGFPNLASLTGSLRIIINIIYISLAAFGVMNTIKNKARELPITSRLNIVTIISDFFGK